MSKNIPEQTRREVVTKSSAFLVAILCCFPIAFFITYLLTLDVPIFEGERGLTFFYLIIPITVITFFSLFLIRSRLFYKFIVFVSVLLVLSFVLDWSKNNYINNNCLSFQLQNLQEQEQELEKSKQEEFCYKLLMLPRW